MSPRLFIRGIEWIVLDRVACPIVLWRSGEKGREELAWNNLTINEQDNVLRAVESARAEDEAKTKQIIKQYEAQKREEEKQIREGRGVYIDRLFWHMDFNRETLWRFEWDGVQNQRKELKFSELSFDALRSVWQVREWYLREEATRGIFSKWFQ